MDLSALRAAISQGATPTLFFFYGHTPRGDEVGPHVLSQWWFQPFEQEGTVYPTAEHFMMAEKARLFGDDEALQAILQAPGPREAKALGREVRGFDEAVWNRERVRIVEAGNLLKFDQHPISRRYLLDTAPAVLVEASPRDRIWGIGMASSNSDARDPRKWRGSNLLGFALMAVRDQLTQV